MGLFDHWGDKAPELGVFFIDQPADGRHGHLLSQQHHEGFEEQGKSTALTGPGNRYQMNSVLWAAQARHSGDKLATVLKKVQMPPAFLDGIVSPAKFSTFWTAKLTATCKVQTNLQRWWFSAEVASHDSPRASFEL
jgi:hypothetical protein